MNKYQTGNYTEAAIIRVLALFPVEPENQHIGRQSRYLKRRN